MVSQTNFSILFTNLQCMALTSCMVGCQAVLINKMLPAEEDRALN